MRRRTRKFVVVALVLAALVAGTAWLFHAPRPPDNRGGDAPPPGAVCRIGSNRFAPHGWTAAFDADGNVVTGGADGWVRIFDAATGREVRSFPAHADRTRDPKGPDALKRLVETFSGRRRRDADEDAPDGIRGLSVSPDGRRIATVGGFALRVFDLADGDEVASWVVRHAVGPTWLPDGRRVAVSVAGWDLLVFEPGTDAPTPRGKAARSPMVGHTFGVALPPSGGRYAVRTERTAVDTYEIVDLVDDTVSPSGFARRGSRVLFDDDGPQWARTLDDGATTVVESAAGTEAYRFRSPGVGARLLAPAPGGRFVCATSKRLIVATADGVVVREHAVGKARGLVRSPDGKSVLVMGTSGIQVFDATAWEPRGEPVRQLGTGDFAFLADGSALVLLDAGRLTYVDPRTGKTLRTGAEVGDDATGGVTFDPWGRCAVVTAGTSAHVFDLATGKGAGTFPDAPAVAVGTCDGEFLRVTSARSAGSSAMSVARTDGTPPRPVPVDHLWTFTEGGRALCGAGTGGVHVIDLGSADDPRPVGPAEPVFDLSISADGALIAAAYGAQRPVVRVLRASDGAVAMEVQVPAARLRPIALSPDGRRLAVPGRDAGTIDLLDVATGDRVATFAGHLAAVARLRWSPDGRLLASSASGESDVLVWDVDAAAPR